MTGFRCSACGEWHDELPFDVGAPEPDVVASLTDDERANRVVEQGDFRVWMNADGTHYFVRGVLEIPVRGAGDVFCYGLWTTLSAASYQAGRAAYDSNTTAGPYFGWLSNRLRGYPDTLNLKTHVTFRPDLRPTIQLEPTHHPLAIEQREGISPKRHRQIIEQAIHPDHTA